MSLDSDYPYINTDTNSQDNGYQYTLHPKPGGAWHVYQPGAPVHQVWVPGPSDIGNVSAVAFRASVTIPSAPPAPIAAAPAPAPAAPAPPPATAPASPPPQSKDGGTVGPSVPAAPSWDSHAPASDLYVNPTTGKEYQVQDASSIGEWHVYKDGQPVWVAGPSWEQTNMTPAQYNAAHPPTATPGPVAVTPPQVVGSTLQPSNGGSAPTPTPIQKAQQEAHPFGGGTAADTAAPTVTNSFAQPAGGATHVVVHGDTMSKIAETNGMPLSKLEALNPQIKDPSLIFPGQSLNLGGNDSTASNSGGSTAAPTPASSVTGGNPAVASAGFPTSSTYQSSGSNSQDGSVKVGNFGDKPSGWATNGTAGVPADPAKGAVSVDTHQNTNPLHINDKNQKNPDS
ncbi:MAG TPA: LysM peptidoglycan-binding domain-containing protein [Candidatus Saccharimonadales bacterium]